MDLNIEEVIVYLKQLGFTEYEAKVYLSLLTRHPASAYSISQGSGVPHSRVYEITRRLMKKGYAMSAGTNPELFSPLSPEELLQKLQQDNDRFLKGLKRQLENVKFLPDFDPVWNITNKEDALNATKNLIDEAHEHIYLGVWDEELTDLLENLMAAFQRQVKCYFLIYGTIKPDFGLFYHHSIENVSIIDGFGRSIDCVVDSSSCISGSLGNSDLCQVVWTRNGGLVKSIKGYIIHDFYIAEMQKHFGDEITKKFGKNLKALRETYGM